MNTITEKIKDVVCDDWKGRINGKMSTQEMLQLFIEEPQVQEFCLERNYPSIEQLKSIKDECAKMGIVVDDTLDLENPKHLFMFGDSMVKVSFTGYAVGQITARHDSYIIIEKSPESVVVVNLYDDAYAYCEDDNDDKLIVIKR